MMNRKQTFFRKINFIFYKNETSVGFKGIELPKRIMSSGNTSSFIQHTEGIRQPVCKKTKWMPNEDNLLQEGIQRFGLGQWTKIAKLVPGRSAKQCRERWTGQLDPKINHSEWTSQEDYFLCAIHVKLGNQWAKIAKLLPGRSPNAVKNRFRFLSKNRSSSDEESNTTSPPEVAKPLPQENLVVSSQIVPSTKQIIGEEFFPTDDIEFPFETVGEEWNIF